MLPTRNHPLQRVFPWATKYCHRRLAQATMLYDTAATYLVNTVIHDNVLTRASRRSCRAHSCTSRIRRKIRLSESPPAPQSQIDTLPLPRTFHERLRRSPSCAAPATLRECLQVAVMRIARWRLAEVSQCCTSRETESQQANARCYVQPAEPTVVCGFNHRGEDSCTRHEH